MNIHYRCYLILHLQYLVILVNKLEIYLIILKDSLLIKWIKNNLMIVINIQVMKLIKNI